MTFKAGFVNIVGNPNVGKSTLMNCLVGNKLSITSSKAQTTRHRIMGILTGENFQIVYSDTPGVLTPAYKLQEAMLGFVESTLEDADLLLYITDVFERPDKPHFFIKKITKCKVPLLVVINKIDVAKDNIVELLKAEWGSIFPNASIIAVSALRNKNIDQLFTQILALLPEHPAYFPDDQMSDKSERFFVAEIIREKIFLNYQKEIPYSTEVEIEEFKEQSEITRIRAIIYVERESQKGIIIGHKGQALKNIGIQARKDIETFLGRKVFIELFVKVAANWRNNTNKLKRFGYIS